MKGLPRTLLSSNAFGALPLPVKRVKDNTLILNTDRITSMVMKLEQHR